MSTSHESPHRSRIPASVYVALLFIPPVAAYTVYWLFRLGGAAVSIWQLWLLFLAAGIALATFRLIDTGTQAPRRQTRHTRPNAKSPFVEANRWDDRLSWCEHDHERFNTVVRERIVELIAERLRLRHGVDLTADPQRAQTFLPPQLWIFTTRPVTTSPTVAQMREIVELIDTI